MGQKMHPIGFRLGVIKTWTRSGTRRRTTPSGCTRTSAREFVKKKLQHAGVSKVEIERAANKVKVNIHTARPGIVIGKRGAGIEKLKKDLQEFTKNEVFLNISRSARPRPTRSWWRRTSPPSSSAASPSAAR